MDRFEQLAADEAEWVGGTLFNFDENVGGRFASTKILAIEFRHGIFRVHGIGFVCGAHIRHLFEEPTGDPDRREFVAPSTGVRFVIERPRA